MGLNGRDQRARHFRFLRQALLRKLPVLTPNPERGLTSKPALGDLQRDEFVLAIFQTHFGGIVGLHVCQHFRIRHQLPQSFQRKHGKFPAIAGNGLNTHQ